ncbi:mitogen-activated protein kinase-binding protein 1-like [Siphateles boraxobius]|uniref:mitogen-activated protein kinase-binding protein 1-like n=1 Tax=Siphateles boraxobius TaxID=180520 RepID=UPI004064BB9A
MEAFSIKSRIKSLLRSPSVSLRKRSRDSARTVTLEKVLGITTAGNSGLTCHPSSGTVAYPAGCVVVLLNPAKNTQQHLVSSSRKAVSTLSFSSDGRFLVTGESGHLPAVSVWDVFEGTLVSEMLEHKYSVSCVAFSPNGKYIVSVGSQHDMSLNLWDWKKHTLLAANKVSSKVTSVSFSEDGSHFVTAGNRHVRFWYLEPSHSHKPVPLMGRSALLGEMQNNFFCGVACGRGPKSDSTFCITSSGLLCEFSSRRVLERWVHLQTSSARALAVTEELIFCACANGTVRVFSPADLRCVGSLPPPHQLGIEACGATQARTPEARYPDPVALTFDPVNRWLSCVYSDHSLYVWDTRDLQRVGKVHSALYHSACVWDLQMFPTDGSQMFGVSEPFLSCSSDGTVRIWSADGARDANRLSSDLLHVLHMTEDSAALLDAEGTAVTDSSRGIRSICVSPDGTHLASGDRSGTLRIHDLTCMKELVKAEAHDSEILCLQYSSPHAGMSLLATASRDRLIQVLDVEEDYGLLQTLDEHSSSVTSVRFAASDGKLRIISCGADKSLYIRTAHRTVRGKAFKRTHHVVRKTTPTDMDVDPTCKYAVVGCQDRSVRVINISSGKQKRSYKGSRTEDGSLLKVQMDPSGQYLATSCSNKNISLLDFRTGECVAAVFGHSEIITALSFSSDCRRLVSASGDSCVFVWRFAPELTSNMRERLSERRRRHSGPNTRNNPFRRCSASGFTLRRSPSIMSCSSETDREEDEDDDEDDDVAVTTPERRKDSGQCEASVEETTGAPEEGREWNPLKDSGVCRPRRRWSCRAGSVQLMVKSMLELRQLDSLPEAGGQNRSCAEDRGSSSSLQDWRNWRGVRPLSAWLLPACAPEPDGVVLYPDYGPSASSLEIPERAEARLIPERAEAQLIPERAEARLIPERAEARLIPERAEARLIPERAEARLIPERAETRMIPERAETRMIPERAETRMIPERAETRMIPERAETRMIPERAEALSPVSGASMGYGSGGSSPDYRRHDELLGSDDDRDEPSDVNTRRDSQTPADGISARSQTSVSASRTDGVFLHQPVKRSVRSVKPLMENTDLDLDRDRDQRCVSQRSHPYISRTPARLHRSAAVLHPAADAQKSLAPSRLRREARPSLSKLSLDRIDPTVSWDSPRSCSYMSPTTSSRAKVSRCASIGDDLHITLPFPSAPAEQKHCKPRACQRLSSPFAEWPSRSSSPHADSGSSGALTSNPGSSGAVTSDPGSPGAVTSDPGSPGALTSDPGSSGAVTSDPGSSGAVTSDPGSSGAMTSDPGSSGALTSDPGSSGALTSDQQQTQHSLAAVKAFSVTSDDQEPVVSLEFCRRSAVDLCISVRRATGLYRMLMSHDAECSSEQQLMQKLMSDALVLVQSELDSVPGSPGSVLGEGKTGSVLGEGKTGSVMGEGKTRSVLGEGKTRSVLGEGKTGSLLGEGKTGSVLGEGKTRSVMGEGKTGSVMGEGKTGSVLGEGKTGSVMGEGKTGSVMGEGKTGSVLGEGKTGSVLGEGKTGSVLGEGKTGSVLGEGKATLALLEQYSLLLLHSVEERLQQQV